MYDIGIIAVACDIEDHIIDRFKKSIINQNINMSYHIEIINNDSGDFFENIDSKKYLNKSKALNWAISKLKDKCKVIIQTDIDVVVPINLIETTFRIAMNNYHVFSKIRNLDDVNQNLDIYKKLPIREAGYGAWNALTSKFWWEVGGYNEKIFGWGGEDDDLHQRIRNKKIYTYVLWEYPLIHINHPRRSIPRPENARIRNDDVMQKYNWLKKEYDDISPKPTVICIADKAMGLGDGCMLSSTLIDLSKDYNVRCLCSNQTHSVMKHIYNDSIKIFNMNEQGHFYTNDYAKSLNLIYWDVWNSLRQMPHHAVNMIRKCAGLPIITKDDKYILPELNIPIKQDTKAHNFINSLARPVIITQPFMSYWNKMIDIGKYHHIVDELTKLGTVIQIGGKVPPHMINKKAMNLIGQTSLEQSLGMIKYSDLVVACDTFVSHAAAHLKTPAVVMFCGTSPEDFGYPFNTNIWHPEIAFCQTKCGRPTRWLYDYTYKDKNKWNSRDETGWICPSKICEKAITADEIITAAKKELVIGRNRDWFFYDYKL